MSGLVEVSANRDGIAVFRSHGHRRRNLTVSVVSPRHGSRRRILFPKQQDVLAVETTDSTGLCEVVVASRPLMARLHQRPQRITVELQDKPTRLLLTGSGRCGTQTMADYLHGMVFTDGTPVAAAHEPLAAHAVPALIEGDIATVRAIQLGLAHNVESAPYYAIHPEAVFAEQVVHLIRDGRRVVQSGLNRGWYQNDSLWNLLKPALPGDSFERSCRFWRLTNENALAMASHTYRLEDLIADAGHRRRFCRDLDIVPDERPLPHSNRGRIPSHRLAWDATHRDTFRAICGSLMDRFYPDWNADW